MTQFNIATINQTSMIVEARDARHWTAKEHVFVRNTPKGWLAKRRAPKVAGTCLALGDEVQVSHLVNRHDAAAAIALAVGLAA